MNYIEFYANVAKMQQTLYRVALWMTRNREDACDLRQDTSLKALDNWEKFVDPDNFKAWILTIMRNIFVNKYHRRLRTRVLIDENVDIDHLDVPYTAGFDSPETSCSLNEIKTAIDRLAPELKKTFVLFLAGYSYAEIADRLSLPLGSIKTRIFQSRKKLRQTLGKAD
jgi:RNA polymerase sigma-70 factor (ECF subfamily)